MQLIRTTTALFLLATTCLPSMLTAQVPSNDQQKSYKISSRIHLQENSNRGYLIVHVELAKGSYIYSLTQPGSVPPSKIKVTESKEFKLLGQFQPDRPATVIAKDPTFDHRIEKHLGKIQFFAPIELQPGVDPKKLTAQVSFEGQVCSDAGFCMPIRGRKLTGKFAGYFQRKPANQANQRTTNAPSNSGSGTVRR